MTLTAGIHGDEPAGVEAALRLLEDRPAWARGFHFTIFPCMNPHGYERHTRHNHAGLDLNRQYHNSSLPEVRAHKRAIEGRRFDLHLSLHEDVDAPGFYIYELSRGERSLAARIVKAVSAIIPFDPRPVIEGRRARRGLIRRSYPPRDMNEWPEAIYLFAAHTDHTLTTETPGRFPFEERARAQLLALETACRWLRRLNPPRGGDR